MRKSCLECVAKHLGSAAVYIEEVELGYPDYYGYAYGELAHASSESYAEFPELSRVIREHRIKWGSTRLGDKPHRIPFEAMFSFINVMEMAGDKIDLPEELLAGLDRDKDGNVVFTADTRP